MNPSAPAIPHESRPSPWLMWLAPLIMGALSGVATSSFTAGGKSEQLAAEVRRNDAQDSKIAALVDSRGDVLVTLGELKVEMRHQRQQLDDIKELLRGRVVKR